MRQAPPSSHAIAAVGWLDAIRIGWVSGANNMLPMIMPEKNTATIVSRRSAARIAQDRASQANQKLLHRSSVLGNKDPPDRQLYLRVTHRELLAATYSI
jgi:hypothetical protein